MSYAEMWDMFYRQHTGLLIFKLFLYEVRLITFLVAIGEYYCKQILLFRSSESRFNAEHYLILQGTKDRLTFDYDMRPSFYFHPTSMSPSAHRALTAYIDKFHESLQSVLNKSPRNYHMECHLSPANML